jgi:glycine dehydrogenase subunit 2
VKLIFEQGHPGRGTDYLGPCDVPMVSIHGALREKPLRLPEVSEIEVDRHYSQLARRTHGVNDGFYPLGSCTMKYNPAINEYAASLPGFTQVHPLQAADTTEGCREVCERL